MTKQEKEQKIKDLFLREAEGLNPPEGMKEEIFLRIGKAPEIQGHQNDIGGFPVGESCTGRTDTGGDTEKRYRRKPSRRILIALAAVLVLLFGTITTVAAVRVAGVRGEGTAKPQTTSFRDFRKIARKAGYPDVKAVETFSNGFSFTELHVSTEQKYDGDQNPIGDAFKTLCLEYGLKDSTVNIFIHPASADPINKNRVQETYEWDGTTVYQAVYIHFELPLDWEEKITDEDRRILESDMGGGGVDSYLTEVIRHDPKYSLMWYQGDYVYHVTSDYYAEEVPLEELKLIARELLEANLKK